MNKKTKDCQWRFFDAQGNFKKDNKTIEHFRDVGCHIIGNPSWDHFCFQGNLTRNEDGKCITLDAPMILRCTNSCCRRRFKMFNYLPDYHIWHVKNLPDYNVITYRNRKVKENYNKETTTTKTTTTKVEESHKTMIQKNNNITKKKIIIKEPIYSPHYSRRKRWFRRRFR